MKHLEYYKQKANDRKTVKVTRTSWADDPRMKKHLDRYPDSAIVKFRKYVDKSGDERFTVEIEVF